jgi:integrase
MARKRLQTAIPGFGCIYRPTYTRNGETKQQAVWWMKYKARDGEVRRSTGQTDQESAYNELAKMHGRKATGEMLGTSPERVTFADLFALLEADYRRQKLATLADMLARVEKHLVPAFADIRVIDLRYRDIERFIDSQQKAGAKPGSINKLLSFLRRAMQLGMDHDPQLVLRVPRWFTKIEGESVRTGVVTDEMYRALVPAFLADHARLAFVIGYFTGLRRSAIMSLRWEWVDWRENVIRIPAPKRSTNKNKPRIVPIYGDMPAHMSMAFAKWQLNPACPFIIQDQGQAVFSIKTAWEGAFERAGLLVSTGRRRKDGTPLLKPAAMFHDLRRTAATLLHDSGNDLADIMEMCGWKTVLMPTRYIQHGVKQAQRIGRRTNDHWLERSANAAAETESKQ